MQNIQNILIEILQLLLNNNIIELNEIVDSSSNIGCDLLLNEPNRTKCLVGLVFRLYLIKTQLEWKIQAAAFIFHFT